MDVYFKECHDFASERASIDPNWCFWDEFVLSNCLGYINLFLAIRSANWNLRLGSLKVMAPVFSAFDRTNYRRLIPQHLANCLLLQHNISAAFSEGGFAVSILGNAWHSVAIDECHEMLIIRDLKDAVTHPGKNSINQVALSFPFKSRNLRNIQNEVFNKLPITNCNMSSVDKNMNDNVIEILNGIWKSSL